MGRAGELGRGRSPVLVRLQAQHSMRQVVAAPLQEVNHLALLLYHCTGLPAITPLCPLSPCCTGQLLGSWRAQSLNCAVTTASKSCARCMEITIVRL